MVLRLKHQIMKSMIAMCVHFSSTLGELQFLHAPRQHHIDHHLYLLLSSLCKMWYMVYAQSFWFVIPNSFMSFLHHI